jgi:hypothetical protein
MTKTRKNKSLKRRSRRRGSGKRKASVAFRKRKMNRKQKRKTRRKRTRNIHRGQQKGGVWTPESQEQMKKIKDAWKQFVLQRQNNSDINEVMDSFENWVNMFEYNIKEKAYIMGQVEGEVADAEAMVKKLQAEQARREEEWLEEKAANDRYWASVDAKKAEKQRLENLNEDELIRYLNESSDEE